MTDYTKLIERVREMSDSDGTQFEAADAIEALQGENERYAACQVQLEEDRDIYKQQRDALQAKMDELQRQEPEGWKTPEFWMNSVVTNPDCQVKDNLPHQDNCRWWRSGDFCNCGAAPKALEPEPLIKFRHGCKWCGKAKCAEGCYGITKGTP